MSLPFFQGVSCVRKGIRDFYSNKKLWKYALFPLLLTFAIYILLMAAFIVFTWYLFGQLKDWVSFLPEWLNGLSYGIGAILFLGTAGVFLLIIFSTVSTFYEMCGGLFFDYLTASYDNKKYSCSPPEQSFRQSVVFLFHIFIYSLNTSILSIILLVQSFFFPMLGQIALLLFAGYRYGFSLISSACNYHGMSWQEIRVWSHKNHGRILGFGITSYILLLIPFAILFVLPGITLGGILLYHDYQEEQKSLSSKNS